MSTPAMLFESFGFRYIGPVDGHNIQALIQALINAKQQDVPVIIHARTTKGKGYEPAENDPVKWHGVNPFNRSKGEFDAPRSAASAIPAPLYQTVFGESLLSLAKDDPRIVAITAAMASGTGLEKFQKELPQQFFDVGICEQHAVTFAAGLACEGFRPVCAIYSTFLQRAYDQVIHDVCIQNLPVVFAMDRAGVVGNDGETHQGVFDISYLRTIPNMVIMSPKDENELRQMLFTALRHNGPTALRYPRGNGTGALKEEPSKLLEIGKAELLREGDDVLLIGLGPVAHTLSALADSLCARHGITCSVINARFAKPLDEALLTQELPRHKLVCVVEDHSLQGGFSSSILEFANDSQLELQHVIKRFGVKDSFVPHASQAEQHQLNGYDAASVSDFILRQLQHDRKVVNI